MSGKAVSLEKRGRKPEKKKIRDCWLFCFVWGQPSCQGNLINQLYQSNLKWFINRTKTTEKRKFTAVFFCKISLKVLLLRLQLVSLLFAVVCDAWLFLLLAISPQTSQLSVNSCAIDQSVTPFLGWRRVCYKRVSSPSFLVCSQSLNCNNNVVVCNRAGRDKN